MGVHAAICTFFIRELAMKRMPDRRVKLHLDQLEARAAPSVNPVDDAAVTTTNTQVTVSVLANDLPSGLTIVSVTQGANGTVTIGSGDVTYAPNTGFNGPDSFMYTVTDGVDQASAIVTIDVVASPSEL
jgi:Bacterial Ig domain